MRRFLCLFACFWSVCVLLPPAQAQDGAARLAGRWQCSSTIDDPGGRLVTTVTRYALLLYPNGRFEAQGVSQGGVSQMPFRARGTWRVFQENGVWYLTAQGQQVTVFATGQQIPGQHITFGRIYSLSQFGHRARTQDGRNVAVFCQRAA